MIKNLDFSIEINTDKETIWNALWKKENYQDWISIFSESSYCALESWEEGGKIMFLGPDKNGIYSFIESYTPNKLVQFKHVGLVENGVEQPLDEETKKWSGTTEKYSLVERENSILLQVQIDVLEEHLDFMKEKFPIALESVKAICG